MSLHHNAPRGRDRSPEYQYHDHDRPQYDEHEHRDSAPPPRRSSSSHDYPHDAPTGPAAFRKRAPADARDHYRRGGDGPYHDSRSRYEEERSSSHRSRRRYESDTEEGFDHSGDDDRWQGRQRVEDWQCKLCNAVNWPGRQACRSCHVVRPESVRAGGNSERPPNTGDSDAAPDGKPSQMLLIRGLAPRVTEELLATGVAKLYKGVDLSSSKAQKQPSKMKSTTSTANLGARVNSILRVFIVRERDTGDSVRYGFVEFQSINDAQAAMAKFNACESFTVASQPITLSYIHSGVFILAADTTSPDFTVRSSANAAVRLEYWDDNVYTKELAVALDLSRDALPSSADGAGTAQADEGEPKPKKRKTMDDKEKKAKAKVVVPAQLALWTQKQAELNEPKPTQSSKAGGKPARASDADGSKSATDSTSVDRPDPYINQNQCLLCMRQFDSAEQVDGHVKAQMHTSALQSSEQLEKAKARLRKRGLPVPAEAQEANAPATGEYRDRAKERRMMHKQPDKPAATAPFKGFSLSKRAEKKDEAAAAAVPQSKGAALLGKMGWSSGQGLGADGSGSAAPLETVAYAAGVGLGASGGKLGDAAEVAASNTRGGFAEWAEKGRERARERFEGME